MNRILIAYFSASGVTANMAQTLAGIVQADLYEIVPAVKYTPQDLDWNDTESRTTLEMADPASRPEIGSGPIDVSPYDVVYIGFPIWWRFAPHIINTFLESYDFSGKTIIPFATSGGNDMGDSVKALIPSAPGAVFKEGKRLGGTEDKEALKIWTDGLIL